MMTQGAWSNDVREMPQKLFCWASLALYSAYALEVQVKMHDNPRFLSWTGPSRQFTGFPARRNEEAASMLLGGATTLGSRETSNRACSALTQWVNLLKGKILNKINILSKNKSGQLGNLG